MVDPVPVEHSAPLIEGDHAEIDLPVASNVLGGESIFLQVGFEVGSCRLRTPKKHDSLGSQRRCRKGTCGGRGIPKRA